MLLPVKRNDGLLQCTSRQKEENQLYVQRSRTELFGGFYLKILASNFQKQICKKKKNEKRKKIQLRTRACISIPELQEKKITLENKQPFNCWEVRMRHKIV